MQLVLFAPRVGGPRVTPGPVRCHHDGMTDKTVAGRVSAEEYQALRLHAVLHGSSVQSVVEAAVRAELTPQLTGRAGRSREDLVAEMLARVGIDPAGAEHLAELEKARRDVRYTDGDGPERGAA